MAFTKFASYEVSEVLDIKGASTRQRTASLDKISDYHDYRTGDGYIYARIIAQSSRVNKNHDGWPSVELAGGQEAWDEITSKREAGVGSIVAAADSKRKKGFSTFIGKPIFVDHNNSDPKRARGVIVDSKLHIKDAKTAAETDEYWGSGDADEEHMPPTEIELLLEIDAESFPKFAQAVIDGAKDGSKGIDGFSMGCDVEYSKCSHCGNKASNPDEYCSHIQMKGAELKVEAGRHSGTHKKSYENCYGIGYFEISGVFDPADETALTQELIDEQPQTKSGSYLARRTADNPAPQADHVTAPENVDTLREEKVCPVCGSDMEAEKCDVCGYEEPPEQLQNPDLTKHQEQGEDADGLVPDEQADQLVEDSQMKQPGSYLQNRKTPGSPGVTNEMPQNLTHVASGGGDEPSDETVTSDQTKPVTAAFRTAQELIQATKRNQETKMANQRHAGEPADPSGKPDKRVNVEGVGGVMDDSLDAAARPDKRVDVEGKGGVYQDTNAEASKPDEKESLPTAGRDSDDAGFNKDKNINTDQRTRTWDNSNEPGSAVTTKPWPNTDRGAATHQAGDDRPFPHGDDALGGGRAKEGVKPIGGPDVQPQRRENVMDHPTSPDNNSGKTDTWTGTGGNGVTRQQDPVTKKVDPNIEKRRSFSLAALKLAETEIELGILPEDKKYDRIVELQDEDDAQIEAQNQAYSKVKTASVRKNAATQPQGLGRVPAFNRIASTVDSQEQQKTAAVSDDILDAAMFGR